MEKRKRIVSKGTTGRTVAVKCSGMAAAVLLLLFLLTGCSGHSLTDEEHRALAMEEVENLVLRMEEETAGYEPLLEAITYHDHQVVSSSRNEMVLEVTVTFPDFIALYESFYREAIDERIWEEGDPARSLRDAWNRKLADAPARVITLPRHLTFRKEEDAWLLVEEKGMRSTMNLPDILLDPFTRDLRAWKRDSMEAYFRSTSDHTKPILTELGERILAHPRDFIVEFEGSEEENKEELRVLLYRMDPCHDALREALSSQLEDYKEAFVSGEAIAEDLSTLFLSLETKPRLLSTTVISVRDPFYYLLYREEVKDREEDEAEEWNRPTDLPAWDTEKEAKNPQNEENELRVDESLNVAPIDLEYVYDIARHGFITVSEGATNENPEVSFGEVYDVKIWQDVIVVLHGILDDEEEYFFFTPETIHLSFFHRETLELLENIEFETYRYPHMERNLKLLTAGDYLILDQEKRESFFNLPLSIYERGHDDEDFTLRLIQGGEEIVFEFLEDNGGADRTASYTKPYSVFLYNEKPYVMMEVREENLWKFVLYDPVYNQRIMEVTEEDFAELALDQDLAPRPVTTFIGETGQLIFTLKYPTGEEKEEDQGRILEMMIFDLETGEMKREITRSTTGSGWIHAVAPFGEGKSIGTTGRDVLLIDHEAGSGRRIPLITPEEVYFKDVTAISEDLLILHHCLRADGKGVGPATQHLWEFTGEALRYVKELEQGHYETCNLQSDIFERGIVSRSSYHRITSPWTIYGVYEELTVEELREKTEGKAGRKFRFELKELLDEGLVYPVSAPYPMASLTEYGHGIFLREDPNGHHLYPLGGVSYILPLSGREPGESKIYHLEGVTGVSLDHDQEEILFFTEKGLCVIPIDDFIDQF